MSQPKFSVGQKVIRINDGLGAVVLEDLALDDEYNYLIQYDEGPSVGNDGTGWWPEDTLEAAPEVPEVEPELTAEVASQHEI